MPVHTLESQAGTTRGYFARDLAPILTIDSGDTVRYRTLDAGWNSEPPLSPETRHKQVDYRDPERDNGHALCGPIAIRGAQPGMTLEIHIHRVQPGSYGWTLATGNTWLNWTLDSETMTGRNQYGHSLHLRPFMGVMGMPPDEEGWISTGPPRRTGGNIDCKELVAGSKLYLPIAVSGGLFSVGDGHALQADGEMCGTAIECPMDNVELQFYLRDDLQLEWPRAETPAGWITFGFDEDLDKAAEIAAVEMLKLMGEIYGLDFNHAAALGSLVVDLRVTQMVNGVKGVHALLPPGAIR